LIGQGVSASTPLLYDLLRRGVDVVYQSQSGHSYFRLVGPESKHSALRVRQVLVAADPAQALALARWTITGKLHNQAVVLHRYGEALGQSDALRVLTEQMANAAQADSLDALHAFEGSGAAAYFAALPRLFDAPVWNFWERAYHPPSDSVNAMLSLSYSLLLGDIIGAAKRIGLDPAIGFFHTIDYGRPSLALDLEQEFRPVIVDTLVLALLQQQLLRVTAFQRGDGNPGGIQMTDDARRFFIERFQERLDVRVRHPAWEQDLTSKVSRFYRRSEKDP
jgi:CRISP-associated protein Cas1